MLSFHRIKPTPSDKDLLAAFKVYDRNGDGLITPSELLEVTTHLGIETLLHA